MTISSLFSTLKVIAIAMFLFAIYGLAPAQAQIPSGLELDGYAWSSNIGWISLNCRTGGAGGGDICGTSNYRLVVNPSTQAVTGYAWSSNIGWVRFGGLTNFPTGGGTVASNANVTGTYPDLTVRGWARACAGTASSVGNCGSSATNPVSGGWDGWLALSGTNYGVRPHISTASYAWGSTVVGWVDMSSRVRWYSPTTLTGTGCTITTAGQSTCNGSLTWSFAPDVSNPTIVRTSPTSPALTFTGATATNRSAALRLGTNTFAARSGASGSNIVTRSVSAVCGGGLVNTNGVCQTPPPEEVTIVSLTANPSIVRRGGTARITWSLSRAPVAGQCRLSGPGFTNVDIVGMSNYTTPALNATARITLVCANEQEVNITVVPAFNEI
ncbi:MAG: hypothetical protein ACK42D_02180 [Candidatus Paceibacteria bacterium]